MYNRVIKPIIIGVLLGSALFLMPFFILKVLVFFLIAGLLIRYFILRAIRRFAKNIINKTNTASYKAGYYNRYTNKYGNPAVQTIEIEAKEIKYN